MNKKKYWEPKRHADTSTLGDIINEFLETYKLKAKYKETFLISSWEKIMGKPIASRTIRLYIQNKKMYVELNSAPLKNELNMSKSKILQMLNESQNEKIVEDIIFL